jgi:hypothetical protein
MQLSYRGIRYQKQAFPSAPLQTETVSIYRGDSWRQPIAREFLVPWAIAQLRYRGATYSHIVWVRVCQKDV